MNNERGLILTRLELIGNDYDLQDWINFQIEKAGYKFIKDLSGMELLDLYDSVLCKIYQ
jgi:DNA-binding protein Fis